LIFNRDIIYHIAVVVKSFFIIFCRICNMDSENFHNLPAFSEKRLICERIVDIPMQK